MNQVVNESLQKMVKGTTIVFFGTIVGLLLAFFGRIIVIRYITTTEYGLLSIGLVILNIASLMSMVGLSEGATRQIAYFKGRNENRKIWSVIISSFQVVMIASLVCFLSVYLFSDLISSILFHKNDLSPILRILSVAIPFTVLLNFITSIFRGFGIVSVKVYFNDFLRNILNLIFFTGIVFFGLSFTGIVYAYLVTPVITAIAMFVHGIKKMSSIIDKETGITPMKKDLLSFSLPLFGQGILGIIIASTDTLMLGYFKTPDVVGLYNAALPIANLITIFLTSLAFIYIPILSQLYSKNKLNEIKRTYAVMTKWVFSATLPVFMIMFLFPDSVLNVLFGERYVQADVVLQLLAIGFFSHTFLGPNGMTLLVLGRTRIILISVLIQTILNVVLNLLLIPAMGLVGAAIASAISLVLINVLISTELYLLSTIHPFKRNYLKPVMISMILIFVIHAIVKSVFPVLTIWMLVLFFGLFIAIYCICILFTGSLDEEDIMIMLMIEKRTGIDLSHIKKAMSKFS